MNAISPVKQRSNWDCGIAAAAMLAGKDYDFVHEYFMRCGSFPTRAIGVSPEELSHFLFFNKVNHHLVDVEVNDGKEPGSIVWDKDQVAKWLECGGKAALAVSNPEGNGTGHWVVWDGTKIVDPNRGNRYVKMDELIVHVAVLVGEPTHIPS